MEEKAGILVFASEYDRSGCLDQDVTSRLQAALSFLKHSSEYEVLLTGGVHQPDLTLDRVIADDMADWLCERNIPRDQIFLERKSYDTWTNILYSLAIIKKRGWRKVVLISNRRHLKRIRSYIDQFKRENPSLSDIRFQVLASNYLPPKSFLWEMAANIADALPRKVKKFIWTRAFSRYRHLK